MIWGPFILGKGGAMHAAHLYLDRISAYASFDKVFVKKIIDSIINRLEIELL